MRRALLIILALFLVAFSISALFVDDGGHSHKITDPKGIAWSEAVSIALAVKSMIDDKELSKNLDTVSITRALHGDNPDHIQYMYLDWPRPNPRDKILDASGQPYLIEVANHKITVKSSTYGALYSLDY